MAHDSTSILLHIRDDGNLDKEHMQCVLFYAESMVSSSTCFTTYHLHKLGHHLNLDDHSPHLPDHNSWARNATSTDRGQNQASYTDWASRDWNDGTICRQLADWLKYQSVVRTRRIYFEQDCIHIGNLSPFHVAYNRLFHHRYHHLSSVLAQRKEPASATSKEPAQREKVSFPGAHSVSDNIHLENCLDRDDYVWR